MFPQLARFTDLGLLLLRLMIGLVFVTSGYGDLKDPTGRAESIGMSKAFTTLLGSAQVAGGLGVAFGVLRFSLGKQGSGARKVRAGITN